MAINTSVARLQGLLQEENKSGTSVKNENVNLEDGRKNRIKENNNKRTPNIKVILIL